MKTILLVVLGLTAGTLTAAEKQPNVLFAIADDWGWPHAGVYGDPVVKTPTFDRIAREGLLCRHGYISSPSCTPSRGAILTGQWHWRLGGAGNLWSVFADRLATYPEILAKSGYQTGVSGKGWGPGRTQTKKRPIAGRRFRNFKQFLGQRNKGQPFCYWLGSSDPHRPYKRGSGKASGMDLSKIRLPACFPDHPTVRSDVADYYFEVQRFDRLVGRALDSLEKLGELDNTIVVMTGDHGMPFPRCKSNLYDSGSRVPLAIRWPAKINCGQITDAFVSLTDLAPTFLAAAGIPIPEDMTGKSLLNLFTDPKDLKNRRHILFGKERHVVAQQAPDTGGYPCRAIRTHGFLYIRNFRPDRWPAGTPDYENATLRGAWYADCDNGPTKTFIVANRDKDKLHRNFFELSFAKRPAEELFDLRKDPHQLTNVAAQAKYAEVKKKLSQRLMRELKETKDPRAVGKGDRFDKFKYLGGAPKHPKFRRPK